MENRQTAIEWLIEQYNLYRPGQMPQTQFSKVCEQAKAIEKEQISKAWNDVLAQQDSTYYGTPNLGEQYYNETYGNEIHDDDKCKCGSIAQKLHKCPYAHEICDDETLCNCCLECEHNCAMDI